MLVPLLFATAISALPSPSKSIDAIPNGPVPAPYVVGAWYWPEPGFNNTDTFDEVLLHVTTSRSPSPSRSTATRSLGPVLAPAVKVPATAKAPEPVLNNTVILFEPALD